MAEQTARNWSSGDIITAANLKSIERGVSAMAEEYTPTTWTNGNTVTAAGLNNIEQGIVNAGSDFSTAEVTFTAVGELNDIIFGIPAISDNKLTTLIKIILEVGESMTVEVPLYKGYCICASPMLAFSNATGSVSIGEMSILTITGDGGVSIALTD